MFKCGEKFTLENLVVDVEIIGFFPKSQTPDRQDYYVALLNGEQMKVKSSFIEMLQKAEKKEETKEEIKAEKPKKEKKSGKRK